MEEQDNNSQNCTQLDYDLEHTPEFIRDVQPDQLIEQNQMPGGTDG